MPKKGCVTSSTSLSQFINPQQIRDELAKTRDHFVKNGLVKMRELINNEVDDGALSYYALNINGEVPLRVEAQKLLNRIDAAIEQYQDQMNNVIVKCNDHLENEIAEYREKIESQKELYADLMTKYGEEDQNYDYYKGQKTKYQKILDGTDSENIIETLEGRKANKFTFYEKW